MAEKFDKNQSTSGQEKPRNWKDIAEVRMLMYVVPVAVVFILIAWILSSLN